MDLYEIEDIPQFLQEAYKLADDQVGEKVQAGAPGDQVIGHGIFNDALYCTPPQYA